MFMRAANFTTALTAQRACASVFLLGAMLLAPLPLVAQTQPAPPVDPRIFGFDLPAGPVRAGEGRRVSTRDNDGKMVVAKVHCELEEQLIVMLPDGQLEPRSKEEVRPTTSPFMALEKDAMATRLRGLLKLDGFAAKETKRYLYLYNTSEPFAVAASRIMETMFPGVMAYAEAQKIEVHEPDVPLVVVMYRNEEEFRRRTKAPEGMLAFYNAVDNRVSLYETGKLADARPDLAVQLALSTIAHEGAHQILHNIGVQQRLSLWPQWISEGLAEFFAPTTTDNRARWKGAGQINDMRMFELEQYFKARPADSDGHLIRDTVIAGRLTSTGYATSWALTHYLAKQQRAEFHKYVHEVSKLGPLEGDMRIVRPGVIPTNAALFEKHFGDDYSLLEKRLVAHLRKQPYVDPFADSPHIVAMISVDDGGRARRDANVFRTEALALKWQGEVLESLPEETRRVAAAGMRRFVNKAAALTFAEAWLRGG
jgi:hypothetical protein